MTVKVELSDPINVVMYPSPRPLAKESLTQESDNALGPDDFVPAIKSGSVQAVVRPSLSYWKDAWIRIKKNPQAMFSLSLIVFMILFTVVGPWIWRVSPADQSINRISEAPTFNRMAKVIPDLPEWEESLVPGIAEHPDAAGAELPAPSSLDFIGEPSTQAVRLKWTPVKGAASYMVYRGEGEPGEHADLGVPVSEVEGGNHVSYEDKFNLDPKVYHYSIVPKNGEESSHYITRRVNLPISVTLADAQAVDPNVQPGQMVLLRGHPLGTDYLGRDLLARLMAGARISLFIGFFAPLIWIALGVLIGGISGYFGGKVDSYLMRITDFFLALPFLLFMILFKVVFGAGAGESGISPMLVAMVVLSWTGAARLTRGQILQLRESEFVQASRLLGARPMYLLARHLLPNTMGVIIVSLTFAIPTAIFTEAFLSFIGMGVVPPTPSWGSMCNDGIATFLTHPHEFLPPAICISLAVLAFNLLGDGLRDALDPKMRGR